MREYDREFIANVISDLIPGTGRLDEEYEFLAFDSPVRLHEDFFQDPITYRYVDGRNAFYVIDRQSDVRGFSGSGAR